MRFFISNHTTIFSQEVLGEIQRLKEEANRFIAILSTEDDPERADELLSPNKRQSLTREVESLQVGFTLAYQRKMGPIIQPISTPLLQLVVEMRTTELHKLREERTRHLQQLEELEQTRTQLAKASARMEDLTVQLAKKTEVERYVLTFTIMLIRARPACKMQRSKLQTIIANAVFMLCQISIYRFDKPNFDSNVTILSQPCC